MHFITFNFKWQLIFHKHFQCDGWLFNRMTNFEIRSWMFDSAKLLSCSIILWFRASVLMWAGTEKPLSQRYIVATKAIFRKSVQTAVDIWFTHSSPEPRKWHFMKNITCLWIIPKITKLDLYFIKDIG